MQSPYLKIINFLKNNNIPYDEMDHEPVFTSEQAAKVRNESLSQGAKSLLLKTDHGFLLAVMPGDKRLSSKKLRQTQHVRDFRFANPSEVEEIMKCKIGACYPFGNLINVKMIVDKTLFENEIIAFNPGVHDKSIMLKLKDLDSVINWEKVDITE